MIGEGGSGGRFHGSGPKGATRAPGTIQRGPTVHFAEGQEPLRHEDGRRQTRASARFTTVHCVSTSFVGAGHGPGVFPHRRGHYVSTRRLSIPTAPVNGRNLAAVSYTHLRAHETG